MHLGIGRYALYLSNNPGSGSVLRLIIALLAAARHVLEVLEPYNADNQGGSLIINHITFVEGRGNIIVEYPGTDPEAGVVSFVGCHMDVVTANPETWEFDPFTASPTSTSACYFALE